MGRSVFRRGVYRKERKFMIMDRIALILAIIGAVNWGLVGFARFDLVAWIFGGQTAGVSRVIYAIVGIAGLWCITMLFRKRSRPEV